MGQIGWHSRSSAYVPLLSGRSSIVGGLVSGAGGQAEVLTGEHADSHLSRESLDIPGADALHL